MGRFTTARCAAGCRSASSTSTGALPLQFLLLLLLLPLVLLLLDGGMLRVIGYTPPSTVPNPRPRAFQPSRPVPLLHYKHQHHRYRVLVGRRGVLVVLGAEPEPAASGSPPPTSTTTGQQQQQQQQQSGSARSGAAAEPETRTDATTAITTSSHSSSNTIIATSNTSNSTSYPTLSTSVVLLNVVAILWGSQHAIIKQVVSGTSNPAAFTLLRFALAAVLASPYTPSLRNSKEIAGSTIRTTSVTSSSGNQENQGSWNGDFVGTASTTAVDSASITTWRWGLELGLYMFLGFAFQAIGLESTTAQRSGFLLYLNVKFVPFLAYVLWRRPIRAATWASALTALTGTALLAIGGGSGDDLALDGSDTTTVYNWDFNVGDAWTIAAAAASAMFILRLEQASARVADAAALNAACLWMVTLCAMLWTVVVFSNQGGALVSFVDVGSTVTTTTVAVPSLGTELLDIATAHPLELVYLGGVTTALCNWLQTKAQRDISAERASIIYAMDPVYGAAFAYLWLGETLNTSASWCGAGLITVAAATNAWWDVSSTSSSPRTTRTPMEHGDQPNGNRDKSN